jgi:hypothetical protein
MQYFGNYELGFDKEFLTESYFYIPYEDEILDIKEFKNKIKTLKDKKKNIAGTIVMYNPFVYPIGYDEKKYLLDQNYDFEQGFVELKIEREMTLLKQSLVQTDAYKGKLVQIRFLFNLNTYNIDRTELLMSFNSDCELLNTNQLTLYHKQYNYTDLSNITLNGKFVFFAWGHKINKKEFLYVNDYALAFYEKATQMQKKISFVFRKSTREKYAIEHLQFLHPIQTGRFSSNMNSAVKSCFKTIPPMPSAFDDINN